MGQGVVELAQVMAVVVTTVVALVGIGLGTRFLWRLGSGPKAVASHTDARLERLEAAVDVIAIEVERISESQRYTVTLLSERLPARVGERIGDLPSPSAKRINTPH